MEGLGMTLQRLVIEMKSGELVLRVLYRSKGDLNPGTKGRMKEVSTLARTGLEQALKALEGHVDVVGSSGFTTREDIIVAPTSPDVGELVKGA
jgi:hypothetical protein